MAVSDSDLIRAFHQRRDALGITARTRPEPLMGSVYTALREAESGRPGQHTVQVTHSPIEALLEDALVKYLHPATRKTTQRPVSTPFGRFRPDFYLVAPNTRRVLVIECDGRDFHDPLRDHWRDAAMLGTGAVHDLLRIEGKDLKRRPHDVLHLVARLFPSLFRGSARIVLERLATNVARDFVFAPGGAATLYYAPPLTVFPHVGDEPVDDPVDEVSPAVHRESGLAAGEHDDFLNFDLRGTSRYASEEWRFRYRALCSRPDLTLDQLVERERRSGSIG